MKKKKNKQKEIIIIENKNFRFETQDISNRNELNVIDGIKIINPLQFKNIYK